MTSAARTSAVGVTVRTIGAALKVTTRASVRPAIASTRGSSALRIATPPAEAGGSASTSSPLALAMFSTEPNSPVCARPTLSTAPIRGGAMSHSAPMWPTPRAAISRIRNFVFSSARSTVSGTPSSLLSDPSGAIVAPRRSASWPVRSLVEVLPDDPVIPATVRPCSPVSRPATARASSAERGRHVRDDDGRDAAVQRPGGQHRHRAVADRGAGEVVAVGVLPGDRGEQPARRQPGGSRSRPAR